MKKLTKDQIIEILKNHKLWIDSDNIEGERADLSFADLSGADLRGVGVIKNA